jgi:hypothetical protein
MNSTPVLPAVLSLMFWIGVPAAGHAEPAGPPAGVPDSSGIISGLNGEAAAVNSVSHTTRGLKIGDRVAAGEEIRVDLGSTVELLWERRALFVLDGRSRIALQQSKSGAGSVQILDGTMRIVYSYNEGHPTDTLRVETPATGVILRGGIIEAALEHGASADRPHLTKSNQVRGTAREIFRVIEGQARIEPRASEVKPFLLKAGYEWTALPDGTGSEAIRPITRQGVRELATARDHHHVPAIQRMVRTHVEHALELERTMSKPRDGNEVEEATGVRGAIVATSLGIPLPAVTGSGATITATSVAPTTPIAPTSPVSVSPAVVPPVVSPPALPPVVTPNVTGLTPSQSGGINSLSLLRDVIQDISRGGNGNGRGRGRGRD